MARSSRTVRTLTVLAAALALLCTACGSGSPPPRLVTSRYETAAGHRIVRDCGFSVPLPGQARRSLWLFCDTAVTGRGGRELGYPILGAGTAAEGPTRRAADRARWPNWRHLLVGLPADAPSGPGRGLLPARAAPEPFLPVPSGLTLPGSTLPCSGPHIYPARWVTGAAREPGSSGHVLISFADYCVSGPDTFTPEGFGLLGYDPAGNALGAPAQVFTAPPGGELPQQRQEVSARRSSVAATCTCSACAGTAAAAGAGSSWPGRLRAPRRGTTGSATGTGPAAAGRPPWRTRPRSPAP